MYLTWWEAERSLVPVQCCRLYEMKWLQHKLWFSQVGVLEWNSIHLCNPDITTLPLTLLGCGANDNLSLLILSRLLLSSDAAPLQIRSAHHYLNYYHQLFLLCGNWFKSSIYLIRLFSSLQHWLLCLVKRLKWRTTPSKEIVTFIELKKTWYVGR